MFQNHTLQQASRYFGMILAQMESDTQPLMYGDGHEDTMGETPSLKHFESIYA